ncbi:MAG: hypothetical protein FCKEOINB_03040 [Nitrosomonas sp.]|nr:hypothetical protein [Nitrosomonas sp.]
MPTLSITIDRGAVERDSIDRKMETNLSANEHLLGKAGDIAYNMMRMWQGASGFIENDGLLSPAYVVLAPKKTINSRYAAYLFKSPRILYLFWAYSYGLTSDRLRLYFNDFRKIPVEIPPLSEQAKIANFLTAIDEKITQLTQKCDLLAQYKKGVMQQIFSQKLRFKDDDGREFPEWEEKSLGDISYITTGKSNREDSSSDGGAYTFFDRSQDIRTSNIYLFDCEAIIVAGEGQEFVPKHFIGKFDLHQRTYAVMNFSGNLGKFLYYYLEHYRYYFYTQAVGSTVKSLRLPMFQKMLVQLPCIKEQTKIANFLTAIDEKITQAQTQLDAVKRYKKGLLQQMVV